MASTLTVENQVIDILLQRGTCDLDDLLHRCPTLRWNQVFLTVDRLSRDGEVILVPKDRGTYTVTLPHRRGSRPD